MKKILIIALGLGFASSVNAQTVEQTEEKNVNQGNAQNNEQIQNKNGKDIMPVKGEFAIGLGTNLSAISGFVGNIFGFTGDNSLDSTYLANPVFKTAAIFGKYMTSDNTAIRASFHIKGSDHLEKFNTFDDLVNSPDSLVKDSKRENTSEHHVSLGLEWRRGSSRLRGFYGGDAILSWSNAHNHYNYGNAITATNVAPTSSVGFWHPDHGRVTEERSGSTFGIGVRGFVGVEYFIAPKICIGTEFGWSAMMSNTSKSKTSYEEYDSFLDNGDGTFGGVKTRTIESLGSRTLSTSIDNFNSQIYFHFYF